MPNRGEVWWANLAGPASRRPVLLLSRDAAYPLRDFCTVAYVTTRERGIPAEVVLDETDGMPRRCVVNLDALNTIELHRLDREITTLGAGRMIDVEDALHFALDIQSCAFSDPRSWALQHQSA